MPPALVPSDDEEELNPGIKVDDVDDDVSDDLDTIPAKKTKVVKPAKPAKAAKAATPEPEPEEEEEEAEAGDVEMDDNNQAEEEAGDEDEDEDEDDEDPEVYAVEKIIKHAPAKSGKQMYWVKWVGYPDEKDMTWELEENLEEGAADILKAYWKKIGGKPKDDPPTPAKKGRKRKADTEASASPAPAKKGRPAKAKAKTEAMENGNGTKKPLPPADQWETQVTEIVTIEESEEKDTSKLNVYCLFLDGVQRSINMKTVRQNCPQKLLDYYEAHLWVKGKKTNMDND